MTKFVIDKSSGSGTATIKVKPNSDNDTSKTNYGVLKIYKKGESDEKTLVGQVSLTQKAEVKPVITYHLELWSSDGSKELLNVTSADDDYNYTDNISYMVGMGITVLGTNTYIVKSYALTRTGSMISKKKVPVLIAIDDNSTTGNLQVDSTAVNDENVSLEDSKLIINNKKATERTVTIDISQNRMAIGDISEVGTLNMGIILNIRSLNNLPIS